MLPLGSISMALRFVEAVDQTGLLAELLTRRHRYRLCAGSVEMSRTDLRRTLGELDGQGARGGGLADAAFAADEDPS